MLPSARSRQLAGLLCLACTACGAATAARTPLPTATSSPQVTGGSTQLFTAPPSFTPAAGSVPNSTLTVSPLTATSAGPVQLMATPPSLGGCAIFPANNPWNQDIADAPVDPNSAAYIASIDQGGSFLQAEFGSGGADGIPYTVVPGTQPAVPVTFTQYADQSDPGPYPIPLSAPVEQSGGHHVLVLDSGTCTLYELDDATRATDGWQAASGAVFPLDTDALRPDDRMAADASGLPILPGLVTYGEVAAGFIGHALRFTVNAAQDGFIHPATHGGATDNDQLPPMGLRLRLNPAFNLTPYHGEALVILMALQRYGMFVADTGSSWGLSGAPDPRWNASDLAQLGSVPGSAFQVVDTGPILR